MLLWNFNCKVWSSAIIGDTTVYQNYTYSVKLWNYELCGTTELIPEMIGLLVVLILVAKW